MGRCYVCCQENCGYTYCSCTCHNADRQSAERLRVKDPCPRRPESERADCMCSFCEIAALKAVLEASRHVRYKTKPLKYAIAEYDRRMKK